MTTGIAISLLLASLWVAWLWKSDEIRSMSSEGKARNAVIWAVVIAGLAFFLTRIGL